jgi:nucleoside-diphosphate-sugar epimerase
MLTLVTGAGGFLGGAVARQLLTRGDAVRSFSRSAYPDLADLGVEQHAGDLADADAIARAVRGCDAVVHTAAKAGVWGPERDYFRANVLGTRHVIAACRQHGVRTLVYTSSPSVVAGHRDLSGVDESVPYPQHYLAAYPRTKAQAEREVLAANEPDLATVALRPHLIWGPGDPHLVPRLLARARASRLRRVGDGSNRVDTTYVENAAAAHLLALDHLRPGAACAGRVYFIAQGEPLPLWDFVNRVLALAGLPPVHKSIPAGLAYALGGAAEVVYRVLRLPGEPPMTRFVAHQLSSSHWFDLSAARRDLGYEPRVSLGEGLRRLGESLHGASP